MNSSDVDITAPLLVASKNTPSLILIDMFLSRGPCNSSSRYPNSDSDNCISFHYQLVQCGKELARAVVSTIKSADVAELIK